MGVPGQVALQHSTVLRHKFSGILIISNPFLEVLKGVSVIQEVHYNTNDEGNPHHSTRINGGLGKITVNIGDAQNSFLECVGPYRGEGI